MDIESVEYMWNIPFINPDLKYKSTIFPEGNAALKWDIIASTTPDAHKFSLRLITAPFGDIEVNYSAKLYICTLNDCIEGEIIDALSNASPILRGKFCFQNYGDTFSNMDVIKIHKFGYRRVEMAIGVQTFVASVRIRITATISRQPKFEESCIENQKIESVNVTKDTYAEALIRAVQADPEFYDMVILVDGTEFKVHKNILAAVSPVLRAALTNNMLEKNSSSIKIQDFKIETVRLMIEFIYRGFVKLNHYSEASELLRISDVYDISRLQKFCTSYLCDQMNSDNILDILTIAEIANADDLQEKALDYFVKHPKAYKADDFKSILKFKPEKLPLLLEKLTAVLSKTTI